MKLWSLQDPPCQAWILPQGGASRLGQRRRGDLGGAGGVGYGALLLLTGSHLADGVAADAHAAGGGGLGVVLHHRRQHGDVVALGPDHRVLGGGVAGPWPTLLKTPLWGGVEGRWGGGAMGGRGDGVLG